MNLCLLHLAKTCISNQALWISHAFVTVTSPYPVVSPEENRTKVSKKGISVILTNLLRLSFFQTEIELNFLVHLSFYFDEITFHILRQNFFCAVGEKNNFILASESRIKFSANSRSAKKSKGRMYRLCTSKVTFC